MNNAEHCVCCGAVIPEGRQVCVICGYKAEKKKNNCDRIMTPQETIETIKIAIAEVEWNYPMEYAVAFENAIESLEKQIPKKPKVLKVHDVSYYKYGECECGEHIMDDEKYCSNCGQALDWSDTE